MPVGMFPRQVKPLTVFQMDWHQTLLRDAVQADWLSKFDVRSKYDSLLDLRERVKKAYEEEGILDAVSKRSYQLTHINIIVPSVDSDEAGLLEVLGGDLQDFLFGVPVVIETQE